jgi:putative protease
LPYDLFVDGAHKPLGEARYLLSPGDLYALEQVPRLTEIGVGALKIEGRYKEAEYVAATTKAYRDAVDAAWAGRAHAVTAEERLRLEQVYSRGLGPFFMTGTNHQAVVKGRDTRHRGVLIGQVERVHASGRVEIAPSEAHATMPLEPGDGVVFDGGDWRNVAQSEEGGRVYSVTPAGRGRVEITFGNRALRLENLRPGDLVWRTDSPRLERELRVYTQATAPVRRQRVDVHVIAREGEPLRTSWTVGAYTVQANSPEPLARAQNHPPTEETVRRQLERLGGTAYELGELCLDVEGQPFLPVSLLNTTRREAVEALALAQGERSARTAPFVPPRFERANAEPGEPRLHLLVRTPEQLDAALAIAPDSVTLDYLDLYGLKPSVEQVKAAGVEARVASPRVLKPGEEKIADFLWRLDLPVLVRPAGLLQHLPDRRLTGDFSLNAANAIAARRFLDMGLERLTPTHDLNGAQITELARQLGGTPLEVIAYQHLPVFHTEHCVFCRFLSTGTSFKDCGRPCENHRVELRDPSGRSHPLLADIGCRNTVFGAEAQEASAFLKDWLAVGIRHFRLEFAHETGAQVRRVTGAFRRALQGRINGAELREELRDVAPQGATQGSLFVPVSAIRPAL